MITRSNESILCRRIPSVYSKIPNSSSQIHGFHLGFHIPDFPLDYQKNIKYNSNKQAVSSLTPPLYGPHRNSFSPQYFTCTGILRTSPQGPYFSSHGRFYYSMNLVASPASPNTCSNLLRHIRMLPFASRNYLSLP